MWICLSAAKQFYIQKKVLYKFFKFNERLLSRHFKAHNKTCCYICQLFFLYIINDYRLIHKSIIYGVHMKGTILSRYSLTSQQELWLLT